MGTIFLTSATGTVKYKKSRGNQLNCIYENEKQESKHHISGGAAEVSATIEDLEVESGDPTLSCFTWLCLHCAGHRCPWRRMTVGHPTVSQVVIPSAASVLHVFVLFCFSYLDLHRLTCNLIAVMPLKVWPMLFSIAVSKDHQTQFAYS